MKKIIPLLFVGLISLVTSNAYAWEHEIAAGYGYGNEIEEDYSNQGYVLTGKFYKFRPIDDTLVVTLDGTVAHWTANVNHNKQLTTVAVAPSFRAYFANPRCHSVRPYLDVSFGPALLSARQFGNRTQGANAAFQTTLEVGTEVGNQKRSLDFNLHLAHYCNAGIFKPNQGINILYIFTVGYQF